MAIADGFIEIFDYYPDTIAADGGLSTVWLNSGAVSLAAGMRGHGKSLVIPSTNTVITRGFKPTHKLSFFGTAFFPTNAINNGNMRFCRLMDSLGGFICGIGITPLGYLFCSVTENSVVGAFISDIPLHENTIENFNFTIDLTTPNSATASWSIRGSVPQVVTGIDLQSGATNTFAAIGFKTDSASIHWDCWIVNPDTTDEIPEVEGFTLHTISDNTSDFTPLTGADNFAMVADAAGCDGDTTYNVGDTVGNKDLFGVSNTTGVAESVFCVSQFTCSRKEESGTRRLKHVLKLAGEHDGGDEAQSQTYGWMFTHYETNPETTLTWAPSALDGIVKSGYEIVL